MIPAIENNLEINYVNISCCFREVLNVHINAHIVTIFYVTLIRVLLQNFLKAQIWCALWSYNLAKKEAHFYFYRIREIYWKLFIQPKVKLNCTKVRKYWHWNFWNVDKCLKIWYDIQKCTTLSYKDSRAQWLCRKYKKIIWKMVIHDVNFYHCFR